MQQIKLSLLLLLVCSCVNAQQDTVAPWNLHFQMTVIAQNNFKFHTPYAGDNSFENPSAKAATSLTSTVFIGRKLWKNAALYFNPEMSGGAGLSGTTGIAGFPNGETFRVGNPSPVVYLARLYLDQYFSLGGSDSVQEDQANQMQLARPRKFYRIIAGKFCLADFFDANSYSHDPRTQFLNWSLMSAGAWDYPANVRGYTVGIVQQALINREKITLGLTVEPKEANGPDLNYDIGKAIGISAEWEHMFANSSLHLIGFYNRANMGDYRQALLQGNNLDVTATRKFSRSKYGAIFSGEHALNDRSGLFFRLSYNDGKHETWAFTEIDHSASAGYVLRGDSWKRKDDEFGVALVANGLSGDHKRYLAAGGYGFIIGDGKLNYRTEAIGEAYYKICLHEHFALTPDIQYVLNPGYNKDRGPVFFYALRGHISF